MTQAAVEKPKVLAFDIFGTVVDWHGSIVREVEALAANGVFELKEHFIALGLGHFGEFQRVRQIGDIKSNPYSAETIDITYAAEHGAPGMRAALNERKALALRLNSVPAPGRTARRERPVAALLGGLKRV